jgi:large repetitive protein
MRQVLLFITLSLSTLTAITQTPGFAWIKTANGSLAEQTNDIVISKDNFVYTCGIFSSSSIQLNNQTLVNAGGNDIFFAKYDTTGNIIWAKSYGGNGADNVTAITTDSLNNIYLIGFCTGTVNFGSLSFSGGNFLLKVNSAGTETWIIEPSVNTIQMDIAADPNGSTVICGYFSTVAAVGSTILTPTVSNDGFVARFNPNGSFSWVKQVYATPPSTNSQYSTRNDACNSVAISPDGRIGVCGSAGGPEKIIIKNIVASDTIISTQTFDSQHAYGFIGFVFQLDSTGSFLWGKDNINSTNSGRFWTSAMNMAANPNGELYIGAETMSRGLSTAFYYPKIIKYSNTGTRLWTNTLTSNFLYFTSFPITNTKVAYYNGKVYLTEKIFYPTFDTSYLKTRVHCLNDFGAALWSSVFTNINSDIFSLAAKDALYAGGLLSNPVFGNLTAPFLGGRDGYLAKISNFSAPVLPLSFSSTNPDKIICPGGNIFLAPSTTVVGGTQPYSYSWTPASSLNNPTLLNAIASPTTSTNYFLQVTDAVGSILRDTVLVTVRPQLANPTITLVPGLPTSIFDTLVCNSPETSLTYQWNPTNGFAIANKLPVLKTGWGAYTVTTTNGVSGCSSTNAAIFYHNMIKANAGRDTTICVGQSVQLGGTPIFFGSAAGPFQYFWRVLDNVFPSALNNDILAHPIANPTFTREYELYVIPPNGQVFSQIKDTVKITVVQGNNTTPTISTNSPTYFCQGSSVTLTASAGTSYLWSNGATTQSIIINSAGNYSVSVYNSNGCISLPSTATQVQVNALPATPTITTNGPTTFCQGGSVILTASAGAYYLWSNGATTQSIIVNSTGNYSVSVYNSNGCLSLPSASTQVQVNALPATPTIIANGSTTFCQGGSVTLTSSAGASYLWSNGATTQSIIVNSTGNYSVSVYNANGCLSLPSASTQVQVNALPATPTIIANGSTTFCQGGSVTLTSSAGTSYLWSNGATTQSIIVNSTGNYSVSVYNANGCISLPSPTTQVQVNALPATPTITANGPTTFCQGGSVNLTSSAGTSYLWSNGATTQSIIVNSTGNYSVSVSNANGCISLPSTETQVQVNALPATPTITTNGPTTFCQGGSVNLTSSAGTSYLWSNGATTQSIIVNSAGNYSVSVYNSNGCISLPSAATQVQVNALPATPTITANGPTTFCQGGSVTLTSSTGTSYLWSNGATTQSIIVNSAGNYSVSVYNANGCISLPSPTTQVQVNALPAIPIISQLGNTLTATTASSYQWLKDAAVIVGATAQDYTYTIGGNYTVVVTNIFGCSSTSQNFIALRMQSSNISNSFFYHNVSPNPLGTVGRTYYSLTKNAIVSIYILDAFGRKTTDIIKNINQQPGSYTYNLYPNIATMSAGYFFVVYQINDEKIVEKIVIIR